VAWPSKNPADYQGKRRSGGRGLRPMDYLFFVVFGLVVGFVVNPLIDDGKWGAVAAVVVAALAVARLYGRRLAAQDLREAAGGAAGDDRPSRRR
jgi:hypothetical protein